MNETRRFGRFRAATERVGGRRFALLQWFPVLLLVVMSVVWASATLRFREGTDHGLGERSIAQTMDRPFAAVHAQMEDPATFTERMTESCGTTNPFLVTTCFVQGWKTDDPAIVAFWSSPDGRSGHEMLAPMGAVGAVWGLAHRPGDAYLYAAAFHKRAAAFGPGGPGAIYRLDLESGEVDLWTTVPDAGEDLHDPSGDYIPDSPGGPPTGRVSLGDIDLSSDGSELFAVNLNTRRIYRYRTADGSLIGDFPHGAVDREWADAEARPFGLKLWNGRLFHAVVKDASTTDSPTDLHAYVFSSEPDGTDMRLVLDFPLDYPREGPLGGTPGRWLAWTDDGRSHHGSLIMWPQPWLTDIEFTPLGDMLLGVRDRIGDVTLFEIAGRLPPGEKNGIPGGDQLIARRSPDGDTWTFDPAEGEFFAQDASERVGATTGAHPETGFGGLAMLASDPHELVVTALSPLAIRTGGAMWFDTVSGDNTRREQLYDLSALPTFGKANGLGDIESLCGPPIHTIYLPYGENLCVPEKRFVDVVLVLDLSTSMRRPTRDGRQKSEAAIDAAQRFVDELDLERDGWGRQDQVGIVGFNGTAWTETTLTDDRARITAALERLPERMVEGTRLDLALSEGLAAWHASGRIPENRPVMVLLTDGLPNRVPTPAPSGRQEDTVLSEAERVKAAGMRIFTIGLGLPDDVLRELLEAVATSPRDHYFAPDGEDLADIYRQIAGRVEECPER